MVLLKEPLEYRDGEVLFEGHLALNTLSRAKRPCVLLRLANDPLWPGSTCLHEPRHEQPAQWDFLR